MPVLDLALQLDLELRTAMRLVREAGRAVVEIAQSAGRWETTAKADATPVTRADLESDRILRAGLSGQFPEDGVVSEELEEPVEGSSGRYWIIDPLDGTKAFIAGTDDYVVQVGLLDASGKPILGCVYEPVAQRMYHAINGVGAFMSVGGVSSTIRQLKVSRRTERGALKLLTSSSVQTDEHARLVRVLGCEDGGRARSVGYKVGRITRREADVYYSGHTVSVWDTCGPLVILEAAGGTLTGLDGAPLRFDVGSGQRQHRGPFIATNGQDHEGILNDLARALG